MRILNNLWHDESGAVLTAETVLVSSVAVLGATVGLSTVSTAVNDELTEVGYALRSLDQSYGYLGQTSCRAWTAGSCYVQQPVEVSLRELCGEEATDPAVIRERIEAQHQREVPSAPGQRLAPAPEPNDLPEKAESQSKKVEEKPDQPKRPTRKSKRDRDDE